MSGQEEGRVEGRIRGEQPVAEKPSLLERLFFMILIGVMISFAGTILSVVTVLQFIVMLFSNGQPNERLGEFGTDLGVWLAKAARYQTAASNVRPWPWTELD